MKAEIEIEKLNKVLDYLVKKPFIEVHELVKLIQSAKPIQEEKDE